jgi:hypothetical protein
VHPRKCHSRPLFAGMSNEQRAIDALIQKYKEQLRLIPADALPAPVYDFDPTGWLLFRLDPQSDCLGGDEFVAIHPARGDVRFLGRLGE